MPYAELDDVTLYYEASGPVDGEPLFLVMGLGAQLTNWYPGFVALLEVEGFRVIRHDNRDVGLSSSFGDPAEGPSDSARYTLQDMSDDVARLMERLGIDAAHVVGASMGGMIVQQLAIDHPERVLSLTSIMSTPGEPGFFIGDEAPGAASSKRMDRESAIRAYIEQERISGLDDFDDEWIRRFAEEIHDRAYTPEGQNRQWLATREAPSRVEQLKRVTQPSAVIHGRRDRLVSYRSGFLTADALPNASFHMFEDMGHQVRPKYWTDIVRIISCTAQRARR